ncbi:ATP-dependent DNA helicase mph1 [Penicillium atrosanguineum]|uniref:ATP-dependent DNA helicase mph1 n=1 Tax=Penicillium atrosanguineum TaxID=1132637 RepID=UPI00238379C0|nr:ATP-dependent DNA helicase mph1 [Penicillium atrosanguineum]KAJ5309408.1 ATP-dependent DNA helicase mph1 [Penicillium atrosanguineum]
MTESAPNEANPAESPVTETKLDPKDLAAEKCPSAEKLRQIEDYTVLDKEGNRVLVIFIRHFFCGSCQEFVRALAGSMKPEDLLKLPVSTSIVLVGCGGPALIDHYTKETGCPFPIYADPTRKLYADLDLITSYALGERPEYFRMGMVRLVADSLAQSLRHVSNGLITKAGDSSQNGGEFLFESTGEDDKQVTWCHRMTNTRDHSSIPAVARVLDSEGSVLQMKN